MFLKAHYSRFRNLPIYLSLHETNVPKISHYNTFYPLKCGHMRNVKCFFTIIQKQWKILMCIKTELSNVWLFSLGNILLYYCHLNSLRSLFQAKYMQYTYNGNWKCSFIKLLHLIIKQNDKIYVSLFLLQN